MSAAGKGLVVITGASSGIGEATARAFSEAGHPLLLLARRVDRMESLGLSNTLCRSVDVADLATFSAAVEEAEKAFGPVECVVNNAGVMLLGSVATQDPEEWQRMLQVNVMGVLNGMKIVLSGMAERKSGTIINISSIAGRKTFADHAVYCATKFGVHAVTEAVREEYAKHDVRVITVAPGVVETELLGHTTADDIKQNYREWKKTIEPLRSEDVARVILFAFQQPRHVTLREIVIGPTRQEP